MSEEDEEKNFHEYQIMQDFLMHHQPINEDPNANIEIVPDMQPITHSPVKDNKVKCAINEYLKQNNLKQSKTYEQGFTTRDEPAIENYVVDDKAYKKKMLTGVHALIKPVSEEKPKEKPIIQSEVFKYSPKPKELDISQRSLVSNRSADLRALRAEEDRAAR